MRRFGNIIIQYGINRKLEEEGCKHLLTLTEKQETMLAKLLPELDDRKILKFILCSGSDIDDVFNKLSAENIREFKKKLITGPIEAWVTTLDISLILKNYEDAKKYFMMHSGYFVSDEEKQLRQIITNSVENILLEKYFDLQKQIWDIWNKKKILENFNNELQHDVQVDLEFKLNSLLTSIIGDLNIESITKDMLIEAMEEAGSP